MALHSFQIREGCSAVLTASWAINLTDDVGHSSLVAHEGSQMGILGCIIPRERLALSPVATRSLAGQESQGPVPGGWRTVIFATDVSWCSHLPSNFLCDMAPECTVDEICWKRKHKGEGKLLKYSVYWAGRRGGAHFPNFRERCHDERIFSQIEIFIAFSFSAIHKKQTKTRTWHIHVPSPLFRENREVPDPSRWRISLENGSRKLSAMKAIPWSK